MNARRNRSRQSLGINSPPSLVTHPTISRVFRYSAGVTSAQTFTITRGCLLNQLVYAETATVGASGAYRLVEAVKLRRVRCWFNVAPGSTAASANMDFEWKGLYGKNSRMSALAYSVKPAVIDSVPPEGSEPAFWMTDGQSTNYERTTMFVISLENSTASGVNGTLVVDVHCDYLLNDKQGGNTGLAIGGGAVAHSNQFNFLDNTTTSGTAGAFLLIYQGSELAGGKFYGI